MAPATCSRTLLVQLEYTGDGDDGWLPLKKHGVQVEMPHTVAVREKLGPILGAGLHD
jgi:hypothetical protein